MNTIKINSSTRFILLVTLFSSMFFVGNTQPIISSFSPSSGPIGTSVTITGSNFNTTTSNNTVYFGATQATVTNASTTSLTVNVPAGATFDPITIINTGTNLSSRSALPFSVTFNEGVGQTINSNSFNTRVNFATGINPSSIVAIADIDGDGKPDMVAADRLTNTFSILRNTTTGTTISFATKIDIATDSTPSFVTIGDLDGDGKLDIIIANQFKNKIWIYKNTSASAGSISFATGVSFITDALSLPTSVAIGDIDGDGKPDLAVTNSYSNTVSILKNTTTTGGFTSASFAPSVDFTTGLGPTCVVITDVDGDGKPDLAIANYNAKTISILRNTTTIGTIDAGSFATKVDFTAGSGPYSIAAGDLNNDNKTDLVVANQGTNTISIFSNTATSGSITSGSLATKVDIPSNGESPYYVSVGNLDGDTNPDILVNNLVTKTMSVIKNNFTSGSINSSSFAAGVNFSTGNYPFSVAVADIDGDGLPDLAVPNYGDNNISVYRNLLLNSLPVNFLNFTGQYQNPGNALLKWQTGVEINTAYYNIQRSINGLSFSTIGKQDALGAGYEYTYTDILPLQNPTTYYRLQELDNNGNITYSPIIDIDINNTNSFKIFPNPTKDYINIETNNINTGTVTITDLSGRTILSQKISNNQLLQIPLGSIATGVYNVSILATDGKKQTQQIVVQH